MLSASSTAPLASSLATPAQGPQGLLAIAGWQQEPLSTALAMLLTILKTAVSMSLVRRVMVFTSFLHSSLTQPT